ncbi:uncharacterized protein ASCRUDRAFT_7972 [Ascoidea rubescens DSM 1968]|uniref:Iron-sulfur assembly protein 1 n=1 Tax=Ascoidea rubescens DSM 1968 TaxID=1344418 RepID=A0A1D2VH64_9ASCO|nr:hypothetical protein ASCRUDRAFT_7972 [Ascoidea rubescens DSM 1968]ODV60998.1 hypothetical protein ASCRUDRAFT_7972 [Ascoidea rubescens DSM 1968]
MGFDLSTQELKVVVTDLNLSHNQTYSVSFDKEFAEVYKIKNGVLKSDDGNEIFTPIEIWIKSLDLILGKMWEDGFPFNKVRGISGSCQQHGTVFWSKESKTILKTLDWRSSLFEQIIPRCFIFENCSNWQDHSTKKELMYFEEKAGSKEKLAEVSGSRAHYRFSGPQILKKIRKSYNEYDKTYRITLISNFLSSLLIGGLSRIDESDACGMNLYDIKSKKWSRELLKIACNSGNEKEIDKLKTKLDDVEHISSKSIGNISDYYVKRYGFNNQCKIYSFTGDNLATIMSLPLKKNDLLISLGTSTTVLIVTKKYVPSSLYHLFLHPTNRNLYMGMICYCNGALPRNDIKDEINLKYRVRGDKEKDEWSIFNRILDGNKYQAFKEQKMGVYFKYGEIIPNALAQIKRVEFQIGKKEKTKREKTKRKILLKNIEKWDVEYDVKGVVESQAVSCRMRSRPMIANENDNKSEETSDSAKEMKPNRIFYVGGGSNNQSIINCFSKILANQSPDNKGFYKNSEANGCALGGAYKASWSYFNEEQMQEGGSEAKSGNYIEFEDYLNSKFNWNTLLEFEVEDEWEQYQPGVEVLEETLKDSSHSKSNNSKRFLQTVPTMNHKKPATYFSSDFKSQITSDLARDDNSNIANEFNSLAGSKWAKHSLPFSRSFADLFNKKNNSILNRNSNILQSKSSLLTNINLNGKSLNKPTNLNNPIKIKTDLNSTLPNKSPAPISFSSSNSTTSPTAPLPSRRRRVLKPRKALITLTPNAVNHLKNLLNQPTPKLIRIGVQNRGCSGLTYNLTYVDKPQKFDEIIQQDDVQVIIDSKALFSIVGSEMDWIDNKLSSKFVFKNPNSKGTCGCGESFMV